MKPAQLIGIILIVLGAIGLIWGGISYTRQRESARLGPLTVTAEERETIPIPPILGGIALIAGIALVAMGGRRV